MNEERFALFGAVYRVELERAVKEHPEEYGWPVENVPVVVDRMMAAIRAETFNKDSRAIRATCKAFGLKHTYKALRAWLAEEEVGAER
jgi:hypothetical protein